MTGSSASSRFNRRAVLTLLVIGGALALVPLVLRFLSPSEDAAPMPGSADAPTERADSASAPAAAAGGAPAGAAGTSRVTRVVDADTYEIDDQSTTIRVLGIDAPETGTRAGDAAREWSIARFYAADVTSTPEGSDVYGRTLSRLFLAGGSSIAEETVREGWACAYRDYPDTTRHERLLELEAEAQRLYRGMWHPSYAYDPEWGGCWEERVAEEAADNRTSGPNECPVLMPQELRALDDDMNGTLSCAEARRHGVAPVRLGDPAYCFVWDADGDGVVCR